MQPRNSRTASVLLLLLCSSYAPICTSFVQSPLSTRCSLPKFGTSHVISSKNSISSPPHVNRRITTFLRESTDDAEDNEIERLQAMAAALRADASRLEAERADELANAAEIAFRKFDTDQDGEISFEELKTNLEKVLKVEVSEKRVSQLMKVFDKSGDGKLQLDEFVGIDKFRNQLESFARDERQLAQDARKIAQTDAAEALKREEIMEMINDKPATNSEKALSLLPYLLPLLDGLQFGRFLLANEDGSNPIVAAIGILYALYRSIPFSGLIAFFALDILSGNLKFNKLIRFNLRQAIYLDIALFFPGLLTGLVGIILSGVFKVDIPAGFTEISYDVIFFSLLASLAYCTVSSLLGASPDKIPVISPMVTKRMITGETLEKYLDEEKEKSKGEDE